MIVVTNRVRLELEGDTLSLRGGSKRLMTGEVVIVAMLEAIYHSYHRGSCNK